MGSQNSTPQTVRIENPQRGSAIEVTPSVASRLVGDEDQGKNKVECIKCKENDEIKHQTSSRASFEGTQQLPHNWSQAEDIFAAKYNELEEYEFEKSLEKVKTMIGEPLYWLENVNEAIKALRHDLIKCYQDHPKQSLLCAGIAKQYQIFIFRKQYETILKANEENKVSATSSTPTVSP